MREQDGSENPLRFLVTGGAGFIGSSVVRELIERTNHAVLAVDSLTYAGDRSTLDSVRDNPRFRFEQADIRDPAAMAMCFRDFRPDIVMHLAAETHVDRSIDAPLSFVDTNVVGTGVLLQVANAHYRMLGDVAKSRFCFHHISTDEVFGSLGPSGAFSETSPYSPRSPYAASKAASDHMVRAWHHTYGLPVVITNCSNNYGPYQFPEKLIPLTVANALMGKPLPVYGRGENVRDWLFVDDHARALVLCACEGRQGETYAIGGRSEKRNIDVVRQICGILDELEPDPGGAHARLIRFVEDRPGHDARYALDASKIERELGWQPRETFESGLRRTVEWYLRRRDWWEAIRDRKYAGGRLGLGPGGASPGSASSAQEGIVDGG